MLCEVPDQSVVFDCSFVLYASGLIQYIRIEEPCGPGTACAMGAEVTLKVSGVRNPRSVKPIENQFTISSYTQESYAIDTGSIVGTAVGLEVEPATLVQVSLLEPDSASNAIVTGAIQTYQFNIVLNNGLQSETGKLELDLPADVELLDAATCVAFEEATLVLLDCEVLKTSEIQRLIVTHSHSSTDFRHENIMLKVQNSIRNPTTSQQSGFFEINSYLLDGASGSYYLVDRDLASVSVQANAPNTLH
jgi:hypothetical protein